MLGDAVGAVDFDDLESLPEGLSITPTANPAVFDYSIDLDEFGEFEGGTISGQVTLTTALDLIVRLVIDWNLISTGVLAGDSVSGNWDAEHPVITLHSNRARSTRFMVGLSSWVWRFIHCSVMINPKSGLKTLHCLSVFKLTTANTMKHQ